MQGWRAHQEDAHNCMLEFSDGALLRSTMVMEEVRFLTPQEEKEVIGRVSNQVLPLCFLFDDKVIVANVGDTRAVLCRDGFAIDLSIMKAGGTVTRNGRVNGGLNLSRALGDHTYKNRRLEPEAQMISPVPDVLSHSLFRKTLSLLLLATGFGIACQVRK
uniref:protein-serine/threonine phosphatase n=1 Tax=Ditylenchus dipsaci TaxID=166011 RepID=A0A915EBN8_9BILA